MSESRICPPEIVRLIKSRSEKDKNRGRELAVKWMRQETDRLADGDQLLIPNPQTGELMPYTKTGRPLQS